MKEKNEIKKKRMSLSKLIEFYVVKCSSLSHINTMIQTKKKCQAKVMLIMDKIMKFVKNV